MLKAKAELNGRRIAIFGIDRENVHRLRVGDPIKVSLDETGFEEAIDIFIFYGETIEDLIETLSPAITEGTVVHGMPDGEGNCCQEKHKKVDSGVDESKVAS